MYTYNECYGPRIDPCYEVIQGPAEGISSFKLITKI